MKILLHTLAMRCSLEERDKQNENQLSNVIVLNSSTNAARGPCAGAIYDLLANLILSVVNGITVNHFEP